MKVVILAGGLGTRLTEETVYKPKPMVEIGGYPILWHLMKFYSYYGLNDFIICLGYKGYVIKEYFSNYALHMSDITFDMKNNITEIHSKRVEPWSVTLVDTGDSTMTGGRLKRVQKFLNAEDFCFTYGDGLSNVNINDLIKFHKSHGKKATVTATIPPGRFGALDLTENNIVTKFIEKPKGKEGFVNGGFFVLNPSVLNYIKNDASIWEQEPLEILSSESNLIAYKHEDFWQPMDTIRDKKILEGLWQNSKAPWKLW